MTAQRISVRSLMRETLAAIGSIYAPLLVINFVQLLIVIVLEKQLAGLSVAVNIIYWLSAAPLLLGAMIFYIYRSLTENEVTVGESFKQASRRFLQLILANIPNLISVLLAYALLMNGLVEFMVNAFNQGGGRWLEFILDNNPGGFGAIFLAPGLIFIIFLWSSLVFRLTFSLYGTIIDNNSALHSISSSWKITKGRFWLMCRSTLLVSFVVVVPILLITTLISSTGNLLVFQPVINVLAFLSAPLVNVYLVLLYLRLRDSAATIQ